MPVDPQAQTFLDGLAQAGARSMAETSPEEMRAGYALLSALGLPVAEPPSTEDRFIPGPAGDIPVRIYRPQAEGTHPVVVFFHGGGFVIGGIGTHDPLCQQLSSRVPAVVVSVDYRLAPEHPFPAAVEDCWAATQWVAANAAGLGADPARLAVAGDSAGGNLAAVVAIRARDAGSPAVAYQLLIYPTTDATGSHPSIQENGQGYFLTAETMVWFQGHYLGPDGDRNHPDASPLFIEDLSGVAPAFIVTAEYDPLRDEGEAYGRRLEEAGVPTKVRRYDGMIHAFFQLDAVIPAAASAITDAVDGLRQALVTAT
ncbi:MAG TPA: alpha/beta hydrolase [Acidimicrobiales bacterium]|nr:alpha/beta hydrolase [Acidimicrobiales bacterium]